MQIYEIAEEYRRLLESLDEYEAIPDEMAAELDKLEGDIAQRVTYIAKHVRELKAEGKAYAEEIGRMQARKAAIGRREAWMRGYIQAVLQRAGMDKVKGLGVTVYMGTSRPALAIVDESAIPQEYYRTPPPELDRDALREALADGEIVPGAALTQGTTLTIRA